MIDGARSLRRYAITVFRFRENKVYERTPSVSTQHKSLSIKSEIVIMVYARSLNLGSTVHYSPSTSS